jgi:hypothetical protein
MEESNEGYDQVGLFRLDVQYIDPIRISDGVAVVPHWGWPPGSMNDRMFYGRYSFAKVWATGRFKLFNRFSYFRRQGFEKLFDQRLTPERYAKYVMRHVSLTTTDACFRRVNVDGTINQDDCLNR